MNTPVHKEDLKHAKQNYRPVSILPTILKVYEKIMFQQMLKYRNSERL